MGCCTLLAVVLLSVIASAQRFRRQVSIDMAHLINEERALRGLTEIPLSYALTYVAELHVENHIWAKDDGIWGLLPGCNLHTWYEAPDAEDENYEPCCYDPGHGNPDCMWQKMREITADWGDGYYRGIGFEIASAGWANVRDAVDAWIGSQAHAPVILQYNGWEQFTFNALGCGAIEDPDRLYFCWFAMRVDPNGSPEDPVDPVVEPTDSPASLTTTPWPTASPTEEDATTAPPSKAPTCCWGRRAWPFNRRCRRLYNGDAAGCIADLTCWWDVQNPVCVIIPPPS